MAAKTKKAAKSAKKTRKAAGRGKRKAQVQAGLKKVQARAREFGEELGKQAKKVQKTVTQKFAEATKEGSPIRERFEKEMKVIKKDAVSFGEDVKEGFGKVQEGVAPLAKKVGETVEKVVDRLTGGNPHDGA